MRDFVLSLGKDIPADRIEDIVAIGDKRKIMKYCMRFADKVHTPEPVVKKAPPLKAKKAKDPVLKEDKE